MYLVCTRLLIGMLPHEEGAARVCFTKTWGHPESAEVPRVTMVNLKGYLKLAGVPLVTKVYPKLTEVRLFARFCNEIIATRVISANFGCL